MERDGEAFRTSWDKVFDAVEHVVTWGLEHRTLGEIDAIGVDEMQYSKGHKYLSLSFAIIASARSRLTWNGLGMNNRSICQPFSCLSFDSSDSC